MGVCQSNRNTRKSFAASKLHTYSDTHIQSKQKIKDISLKPKTLPTLNTSAKEHISTCKTPTAIRTNKRMIKEALAKSYSVLNIDFGYSNHNNIGLIQHNITGQVRTATTILKEDDSIYDMDQYINKIRENNLVSPHINNVIELFEDFKCYYIIQQYCSGGMLSNLSGKIDEDNAIYIISQILDALREIHNSGSYHGSLSIQSFALQDQSNNYYVKLIDIFPIFQVKSKMEILKMQQNDIRAVGFILFQLITNKQITKQITEMVIKKSKDLLNKQSFWSQIVLQLIDTNNQQVYENLQKNTQFLNIQQKYQSLYAESIFRKLIVKKTSYLQQQILLIMNKIFFSERQKQIQKIFTQNDTNQNGTLQRNELKHALGIEDDIDELFDQIDIDGNGKIDMNEFIFHSCDRGALINEFNLNVVFNELQRKGFINPSYLTKYQNVDENKIQTEIQNRFKNQKLNKQDFFKLMFELL